MPEHGEQPSTQSQAATLLEKLTPKRIGHRGATTSPDPIKGETRATYLTTVEYVRKMLDEDEKRVFKRGEEERAEMDRQRLKKKTRHLNIAGGLSDTVERLLAPEKVGEFVHPKSPNKIRFGHPKTLAMLWSNPEHFERAALLEDTMGEEIEKLEAMNEDVVLTDEQKLEQEQEEEDLSTAEKKIRELTQTEPDEDHEEFDEKMSEEYTFMEKGEEEEKKKRDEAAQKQEDEDAMPDLANDEDSDAEAAESRDVNAADSKKEGEDADDEEIDETEIVDDSESTWDSEFRQEAGFDVLDFPGNRRADPIRVKDVTYDYVNRRRKLFWEEEKTDLADPEAPLFSPYDLYRPTRPDEFDLFCPDPLPLLMQPESPILFEGQVVDPGKIKRYFFSEYKPQTFREVLGWKRVSRVTRAERKQSCRALVLVGNSAGVGGYGIGRGPTWKDAIADAEYRALQHLVYIERYRGGLAHTTYGFHNKHKVIITCRRQEGPDVHAAGIARTLLECFGLRHVAVTMEGGTDTFQIIRAWFDAMKRVRGLEEMALFRGRRLWEAGRVWHRVPEVFDDFTRDGDFRQEDKKKQDAMMNREIARVLNEVRSDADAVNFREIPRIVGQERKGVHLSGRYFAATPKSSFDRI